MDAITLEGFKPYDGRYELDLGADLTTREWGWIKRLAGYVPSTLNPDAFSDPELACVFAVIVLHRRGRVEKDEVPELFERLRDAPFAATIKLEFGETDDDEAGADAGPPSPSSNANDSSSGDNGRTSSATLPPSPVLSGTPDSGFSPSPLETGSGI